MANIGDTIRSLRKQQGLTQDELAARLHVTRQTVSNYENGRSEPDLDMLMELATVLGTDAAALLDPKSDLPCPAPDGSRTQVRKLLVGLGLLLGLWTVLVVLSDYAAEYFRMHYGGCWTLLMLRYDAKLCIPMAAGYLIGRCHMLLSPRRTPVPLWMRGLHGLLLAAVAACGVLVVHDVACGVYMDVLYWQQWLSDGAVNIQFEGFIPLLTEIRYRLLLWLTVQYKPLGILLPGLQGYLLPVTK